MKSKTVLITGASRGIGRACTEAFAAAGYKTVGTYLHSGEKAAELETRLKRAGYDVIMKQLDVADSGMVNALRDELAAAGIAADVLVNNAGIAQQKLFTDITDDDWNRMIAADLSGAFYTCRAFLPAMISNKYGRIINISSVWGVDGGSCEVHYSAAKAGLIGLTKALAKEEGLAGITVNAVAPGATATDMLSGFTEAELADIADESALNKIVTPQAVASAVLYLASDEAGFITGEVLNVNAGRL